MTYQGKATQISLLLHAVLILGGLLLGRSATTVIPPLVIELSITGAVAATGEPDLSLGGEQQGPAKALPAQTAAVVAEKQAAKTTVSEPQKKQSRMQAKPRQEKAEKAVLSAGERPPPPAPLPVVGEQQQSGATPPAGALQGSPTSSAPATAAPATSQGQQTTATQSRLGGGGAGGAGTDGGPTDHNFEYIRRLILNNLSFPATARKMGLTGKIVVSFLLRADGQVEDLAVVSGSGHRILDNNVLATIRRLAPFPKPPARAQLVLPIVYNLR